MAKRGAPPGNQNALKHGFYSRRFRDVEPEDLEVLSATLESEIAGLRVAARRIFEYSEQVEEADPMSAIHALNCFGATCTRIAQITRVLAFQAGQVDESQAAINIALATVAEEISKARRAARLKNG